VSTLAKPVKTHDALVVAIDGFRHVIESARRHLVLLHLPGSERDALTGLLAADDIDLTVVGSLSEAIEHLRAEACQCLVVGADLGERDIDALAEYFGGHESGSETPIIVYGRQELSPRLQAALRSSVAAVSFVASPERLLDQSALLLHRPVSAMPEHQRRILEEIHHSNRALAGRKALIVDDDIRNIFALTAILEQHDMRIVSAETGRAGIEILEKWGDIDVVLMDIMMPEMDGFETTRAIRSIARFKGLPVIAVTAKAMKGDREKCIEAGASDYLSKPVDPDELVAKLRGWLLQ
jgi:CheY-like chemotaxis protein